MANHKSAKKRIRGNETKRRRNKHILSSVRTSVKKYRQAVEELAAGNGDVGSVQTLLKAAQSRLGKAAQKGIIHRRNAARQISRLTKRLAGAQQS